jgi:hypothetical protein
MPPATYKEITGYYSCQAVTTCNVKTDIVFDGIRQCGANMRKPLIQLHRLFCQCRWRPGEHVSSNAVAARAQSLSLLLLLLLSLSLLSSSPPRPVKGVLFTSLPKFMVRGSNGCFCVVACAVLVSANCSRRLRKPVYRRRSTACTETD